MQLASSLIDSFQNPRNESNHNKKVDLTNPEFVKKIKEYFDLQQDEPFLSTYSCSFIKFGNKLDGTMIITPDPRGKKEGDLSLRIDEKKWENYYFVLEQDFLAYFLSLHDKRSYSPEGLIPLDDIHSIGEVDFSKPHTLQIVTSKKLYFLSASSEEEKFEWIAKIKEKTNHLIQERTLQNATNILPLKTITEFIKIPDTPIFRRAISIKTKIKLEFLFCSFEVDPDSVLETIKKAHTEITKQLPPSVEFETEEFTVVSAEQTEEKLASYSVSSHENAEFHRIFNLPETEVLVEYYSCALVSSFFIQGWIYISKNFLCFANQYMSSKRVIVLPLKDITNMGKLGWFYSGIPLPKSIFIKTNDKEFIFAGFFSKRSEVLHRIQFCKNNSKGSTHNLGSNLILRNSLDMITEPFEERLRFTILIVGSRGDVQPFIALGLGLEKIGHKVRIATHLAHESFVKQYGLEFFPLAGDPKALIQLCVENDMFSYSFIQEGLNLFTKFIEDLFSSCWEACKTDTDVIIQNPPSFAGVHVAEKLDIPLFISFTMPWSRTTAFPHPFAIPPFPMGSTYNYTSYVAVEHGMYQPIRGLINQFREKIGLVPIEIGFQGHSLINDRKIPHIYCWSPSVLPKPDDWPDYINVCGYWFLDFPTGWKPPEDLIKFLKRTPKPVYIGFGSVTVPNPDGFTKLIVDALVKTGQRAVLVKGWGGLGNIDYPENVYAIDSIPHDWLFPQVAAVIHHGGAGTTAAGLRAGCPTCIVPFFGDQFFWATRVVELGVGVPPLFVKSMTVDTFADALKALTDVNLMAKASALGEQIRSQDGIGRAIKFIHTYLKRIPKKGEAKSEEEKFLQKKGILKKQGRYFTNWKARFFEIKNKELCYYTDHSATTMRGKFSLVGCTAQEIGDIGEFKFCFTIKSPITRSFVLSASSDQDRQEWLNSIEYVSKGILFSTDVVYEKLEGYLEKKGDNGPSMFKTWKKRYFVNNGYRLSYYESKETYENHQSLGYIPLQTLVEVEPNPYYGEFAFHINTSDPKREWILRAENSQDLQKWVNFLRKFLKEHKPPLVLEEQSQREMETFEMI